jgi:hypothetical protein
VSISEKLRRKHERKQKDPVKYRALANKNQKLGAKSTLKNTKLKNAIATTAGATELPMLRLWRFWQDKAGRALCALRR